MIYKYTKCESVIAKIMADSNMSEKDIRITDIREWIFEAVEKIGAPMQYIRRESGHDGCPVFHIHEGQIPIPEDLESLITVAYSSSENGPFIQVRKDDKPLHRHAPHYHTPHTIHIGPAHDPANIVMEDEQDEMYLTEYGPVNKYTHIPRQPMVYKQPTTLSQVYTEMSTPTRERIQRMVGELEDVTYFVKPGWIVLNKPTGYVKLVYSAIATDERGYPLIPDKASYQEAIYWYVMMKINFPKFLTGSLGGRTKYNFNTYAYLQQQWNFYRNQAYAEAMMPNDGEMMSIKNEWNRLIPDYDDDRYLFHNIGREQLLYNDRYGY